MGKKFKETRFGCLLVQFFLGQLDYYINVDEIRIRCRMMAFNGPTLDG
jgi:hypothetical protein